MAGHVVATLRERFPEPPPDAAPGWDGGGQSTSTWAGELEIGGIDDEPDGPVWRGGRRG